MLHCPLQLRRKQMDNRTEANIPKERLVLSCIVLFSFVLSRFLSQSPFGLEIFLGPFPFFLVLDWSFTYSTLHSVYLCLMICMDFLIYSDCPCGM